MEQGSSSPQNSTSSSLEQSKISSIMPPHFLSPRPLENLPRVVDAEEQVSYLALLTRVESPKSQQIGSSFTKAPTYTQFGDASVDAQRTYCMPNVILPTTPTPIRPMITQGTGNVPYTAGGKAYEGSTLKRKTVSAANMQNCSDQGYNSRNYGGVGNGYSVYDERYHALGLPVDPHLRMFNEIFGRGNAGFS